MRIDITPQGPYLVSGAVPLRRRRALRTEAGEPVAWETGQPLDTRAEYALCRCGGSANKPFCDGTHNHRDWDGTLTAPGTTYDERVTDYVGPGMVLGDDRTLCAHAGFCATKQSNAWKLSKDSGDTAVRSQLVAMVEHCPSGALTHRSAAGGQPVEPDLAPSIGLVDDGPLHVTGSVPVTRPDGVAVEARNRMTLCRCGASQKKPFCDGSHAAAGFRDS